MEFEMILIFKRISLVFVLLHVFITGYTQTFDEWFRQKKTQREYLLKQIAALKVFSGFMQEGYSIAQEGLSVISSAKEEEKDCHETYYGALLSVNQEVNGLDIIVKLSHVYQHIIQLHSQDNNDSMLQEAEKIYIKMVLNKAAGEAFDIMDQLLMILSDQSLALRDYERIDQVNTLYNDTVSLYNFLRTLNQEVAFLSLRRKKERGNIHAVSQLSKNNE